MMVTNSYPEGTFRAEATIGSAGSPTIHAQYAQCWCGAVDHLLGAQRRSVLYDLPVDTRTLFP